MPADSVTSAMLLLHLAATWYLVGLCWLVQRVQYPLMRLVGPASFGSAQGFRLAAPLP